MIQVLSNEKKIKRYITDWEKGKVMYGIEQLIIGTGVEEATRGIYTVAFPKRFKNV